MKKPKNYKNILIKKYLPDLLSESPICATYPDLRLYFRVAQKAKIRIFYV
tara:strand:+ start:13119 stop:13268 length:150 start_codon:yes stop_codon:yes gene_type:complete